MYSAEEIKTIIDRQLSELQLPEGFPGLYNPVNYILQLGGKRIRPFLTMMSENLLMKQSKMLQVRQWQWKYFTTLL